MITDIYDVSPVLSANVLFCMINNLIYGLEQIEDADRFSLYNGSKDLY